MAFQFACARCGCPSIKLPTELTAQSVVTCDQCGESLATWDEFKRLTTSIVLSEQSDASGPLDGASYDPLAHDTYEPDREPPSSTLVLRSSSRAA